MRLYNLPVLGAVAVLFGAAPAVAAYTPTSSNHPQNTSPTKCHTGQVKYAAGQISLAGYGCTLSGKKIPVARLIVTHTYSLQDYAGRTCALATAPVRGASFTPSLAGVFSASVRFTVTAFRRYKGLLPAVTPWQPIILSGWQLQCGTLSSPLTGKLCGYDFGSDTAKNVCGKLYKTPNYHGPTLPQLGGPPLIRDGMVLAPPIRSVSGNCRETVLGAAGVWLGQEQQQARWDCDNGDRVETYATIYYYPPGSSSLCVQPNVPYTAGYGNLPGNGQFTHISLPTGFEMWGGRLAIIYKALFYNRDNRAMSLHAYDGWQYADTVLDLKGVVNACSLLIG